MPKETEVRYKVFVVNQDGGYESINPNPVLALEYKKGEKAEPKVGKLFVFDRLGNARRFHLMLKNTPASLWEVECGKAVPLNYSAPLGGSADRVKGFWDFVYTANSTTEHDIALSEIVFPTPMGTMITDWVIPVKELFAPPREGLMRSRVDYAADKLLQQGESNE